MNVAVLSTLSGFSYLTALSLRCVGAMPIDGFVASFRDILSSINSYQLEELSIYEWPKPTVDFTNIMRSLEGAWTGLQDIDDILSSPKFLRLRRFNIIYIMPLLLEDIPVYPYEMPFPCEAIASALPFPADQEECTDPAQWSIGHGSVEMKILRVNSNHPFLCYGEHFFRQKVQEGLRETVARGILNLGVDLQGFRKNEVVNSVEAFSKCLEIIHSLAMEFSMY